MTQTTQMPQKRKSIPGLVALVLGLIITIAVGVALVAARNDPDEPTSWRYHNVEYSCDEIPMAVPGSADAWRDQCGG